MYPGFSPKATIQFPLQAGIQCLYLLKQMHLSSRGRNMTTLRSPADELRVGGISWTRLVKHWPQAGRGRGASIQWYWRCTRNRGMIGKNKLWDMWLCCSNCVTLVFFSFHHFFSTLGYLDGYICQCMWWIWIYTSNMYQLVGIIGEKFAKFDFITPYMGYSEYIVFVNHLVSWILRYFTIQAIDG